MSSVDRWRPPRAEAYKPPSLPPKPPVPLEQAPRSPSQSHRPIPPAVPSPPTTQSSRMTPPRPASRRSATSPPRRESTPQNSQQRRANQWFFTASEAVSTPSVIDGISPQEERLRRAKGVNFIYQAGILLDLPQLTLWVAGVFFHRFYMRYSMDESKGGVHHYNIAATALFLANKTEENCRKTRDLIVAVAKVAQKNPKLIIDEQSKEYWRWRDSILAYEELMLEMLTFDLMVEHPYHRLFDQLTTLNLHHNKRMRDAAWTFLNDCCLTIIPLLMEAREIATSAIFFAATVTNTQISDVNGRPWWAALGGSPEKISRACHTLAGFLKENPLQKKQQPGVPGSPVFSLESTRRSGEDIPPPSQSHTNDDASRTSTPALATLSQDRGLPQDPSKAGSGSLLETDQPTVRDTSQNSGDSDAGLKAAANTLDMHDGKLNGLSEGKRKAAEDDLPVSQEGRASKRARADEGGHGGESIVQD